jgi:chromatin remodeling complex protein RSC6
MTAKVATTKKTTTKKVTTLKPTTKKSKTPKYVLKTLKAEKRTKGKAAQSATGKKNALAMKKAGKGIFAPKTLSSELASICGAKVMSRPEVTKKVWTYIKSKKLNSGRVITPDATLGKVFPKKMDMLQIAKVLSAHLK